MLNATNPVFQIPQFQLTNPAVGWKTSCLLAMTDDARSVGWSRSVLGSVRAGKGLGEGVGFGQGGSIDANRSLLEGRTDRDCRFSGDVSGDVGE